MSGGVSTIQDLAHFQYSPLALRGLEDLCSDHGAANRCRIDAGAVGVAVHNEEHPQLRVIEIIDHDKGRASDSMRAKIDFRIAGLCWKLAL